MKHLILGGARSGKSRLAEQVAHESALEVVYIATASPGDGEMSARIKKHRERRPAAWKLVEEPYYLAQVLEEQSQNNRCLLVDCLTLWTTNLLLAEDESLFIKERKALLNCIPTLKGELIFVSNEVSMGVVPMGELSRRFVDESGQLHQDIAQLCERVILSVAGLPHILKDEEENRFLAGSN